MFQPLSHPSVGRILAKANLQFIALQLWASFTTILLMHLVLLQGAPFEAIWDVTLQDLLNVPSYLPYLTILAFGAALTTLHLGLSISFLSLIDACHQETHRALYRFNCFFTSCGLLCALSEHFNLGGSMSLTEALTFVSCSSLFLLLPFFIWADNIFTHAVSAAAHVSNDQSLGEERGASHIYTVESEKVQTYRLPAPKLGRNESSPLVDVTESEATGRIVCVDVVV